MAAKRRSYEEPTFQSGIFTPQTGPFARVFPRTVPTKQPPVMQLTPRAAAEVEAYTREVERKRDEDQPRWREVDERSFPEVHNAYLGEGRSSEPQVVWISPRRTVVVASTLTLR